MNESKSELASISASNGASSRETRHVWGAPCCLDVIDVIVMNAQPCQCSEKAVCEEAIHERLSSLSRVTKVTERDKISHLSGVCMSRYRG